MSETVKSIGQVAYEAFHDGEPPRSWDDLNSTGRMRWDYIAERVIEHSHKLIAASGTGWT